jgi:hypothetical protein
MLANKAACTRAHQVLADQPARSQLDHDTCCALIRVQPALTLCTYAVSGWFSGGSSSSQAMHRVAMWLIATAHDATAFNTRLVCMLPSVLR